MKNPQNAISERHSFNPSLSSAFRVGSMPPEMNDTTRHDTTRNQTKANERMNFLFAFLLFLIPCFNTIGQGNTQNPPTPLDSVEEHAACGTSASYIKLVNDTYIAYQNGDSIPTWDSSSFKVSFIGQGTFDSQYPNAIDNTCTDYFRIYYEDIAMNTGLGFAHPTLGNARKATLCKVLNDIEDVIDFSQLNVAVGANKRIDLFISRSFDVNGANQNLPPMTTTNPIIPTITPFNVLGAPFFAANVNTASGYYGGNMHDYVINGNDPDPNNYDGQILVNFAMLYTSVYGGSFQPESYWDNYANTPANCSYDLYSILLHEITHVMGWYSMITQGPMPNMDAVPIAGSHFFSILDKHYYYHTGTAPNFAPTPTSLIPFVNLNGASQPQINPAITALSPVTLTSSGILLSCLSTNRVWLGNEGNPYSHPVYSEHQTHYSGVFWSGVPSVLDPTYPYHLCHLDYSDRAFYARTQLSPGFQAPYVMDWWFFKNEKRRTWTIFEMRTLQNKLGYSFNPNFLGSFSLTPSNITPTFNNGSILNNHPSYRTNNNVLISQIIDDVISYPINVPSASAYWNSIEYYPENYPLDFTVVNNNTNSNLTQTTVTIDLSLYQNGASPSIKDDDNDMIAIMPGSLFGIRGVSDGGNNHNRLLVNPSGTVITYTPEPGYVGLAQFGFNLWDGKEKGSFKVITIKLDKPTLATALQTLPPSGNRVINPGFEDGTEVKEYTDISKPYSRYVDGIHAKENVIHSQLAGGHPFLHWLQGGSYDHFWTREPGSYIKDAAHLCIDNLNPNFTETFNRFNASPALMGSGGFATILYSGGLGGSTLLCNPQTPNPTINKRYAKGGGLFTYSTLKVPLQSCHTYRIAFDVALLSSYSLPNSQLSVGVYFTKDPSSQYNPFPVPIGTPSNLLQQVDFSYLPVTSSYINANCTDHKWVTLEKTFTYCGSEDCYFFALNSSVIAFYDNISITEVSSPQLLASITASNNPSLCGVTLTANLTSPPCPSSPALTYSWNTGQTTQSIVATQMGIYTVWISGCGISTASYNVTTLPFTVDAGNPVTLCPGQQTTFSPTTTGGTPIAYLWQPATGLSCTACANPVCTASTTTTYTLTVTFPNGCKVSDDVTVTVLPPDYSCLEIIKHPVQLDQDNDFSPAIVSGDQVAFRICVRNKCESTIQNVVLTDILPQELTYTGSNVGGGASSTLITSLTYDPSLHQLYTNAFDMPPMSIGNSFECFTIYTDVGTVSNTTDCLVPIDNTVTASADNGVCTPPSATGTVYVVPSATGFTFHHLEQSSQLSQSIYINEKIVIDGYFYVDNGLTLQGCDVILTPGSAIHVQGNNGGIAKLILDGSTLRGCDKLWRGIFVHGTGYLHTLNDTHIQDAKTAVVLYAGSPSAFPPTTSQADIENTYFDKNYIGIDIPTASYDEGAVQPILRLNEYVEFDATAHLLDHYNNVGLWQTIPLMGNLSYAGIRMEGFNLVINPQSPSGGVVPRVTFRNQNFGILSFDSNLKLRKCVFEDIQPDNVYPSPLFNAAGSGIFAVGMKLDGTATLRTLFQNGFMPTWGNPTFKNCHIGVQSWAMYRTEIEQNTMQNMRTGIQVAFIDNPKKAFIHNNRIEAWGTGVNAAFCAGSIFTINENAIHLIAGGPIGQAAGISVGDFWGATNGVSIFNNFPIQISAPGIGIQLQKTQKCVVNHNNITIDNGLIGNGAGTIASAIAGVQVNGTENSILSCNSVTGPGTPFQLNTPEALPTDPTNSDYMAYHINGSPNLRYECNYSDGTKFGFHFNGNCQSDNNFVGNEMHDHYEGLRINNQSLIGSQQIAANGTGGLSYRGNTWTGSSGLYEAHNMGVPGQSLFDVNDTGANGADFLPFPLFPSAFWFDNPNLSTNYSCDNSIYCNSINSAQKTSEDSLLSETDYSIVHDSLLTYEYQEQVRWASERNLYERLRDNTSLLSDSEMSDFFLSLNNSVIETLVKMQEKERKISEIDSLQVQLLDSLNLQIVNKQNLIAANDSLLTQGGDSTLLTTQNLQLYLQINSLLQIAKLAMQNDRAQDSLAIDSLKIHNSGIITSKLYEQNEQVVKAIYYATIGRGIYHFTESQATELYAIASQCPLAGGNAVFAARNLYKWMDDKIGFNDRALCDVVGMQYRQLVPTSGEKVTEQVQVYPNPANNVLYVKITEYLSACNFELYNSLGEKISSQTLTSTESTLEIESLCSGIYYYRVNGENGINGFGKIIIQH